MSNEYLMFRNPSDLKDKGTDICVANNNSKVIEMHKSVVGADFWYNVGAIKKEKVQWANSTAKRYLKPDGNGDVGTAQKIAMNKKNNFIEIHKTSGKDRLWVSSGTVGSNSLKTAHHKEFNTGKKPDIAINDHDIIATVYEDTFNRKLYLCGGKLDGLKANFKFGKNFDKGRNPSIAINNNNYYVEVHNHSASINNDFHYCTGKILGDGSKMESLIKGKRVRGQKWEDGTWVTSTGSSPSVTLTDDGKVNLAYIRENEPFLISGVLDDDGTIKWDTFRGITNVAKTDGSKSVSISCDSAGKNYVQGVTNMLYFQSSSVGLFEVNNDLEKDFWYCTNVALDIGPNGEIQEKNKAKFKMIKTCVGSGDYNIHRGFLAIYKGNLIMACSGTDGGADWMNNLLIFQTPYPYGPGNVHLGFWEATDTLSVMFKNKEYVDIINQYRKDGGKRIYLVGHSKGGAVAALMAGVVKELQPDLDIFVLSYGSPKIGDKDFIDNYKYKHYRYESNKDTVPQIPPHIPPLFYYHAQSTHVKYNETQKTVSHNSTYAEFIGYDRK